MAMPPTVYVDTSGSTAATTWSLYIDSGMRVDSGDYCIATVTEL